jgi:hypothetical protein
MAFIEYRRECWASVWPGVERLARMHFDLDNPSGSPKHGRFDLDVEQFELLDSSGAWRVFTARVNGALVGYSTWTVLRDLEVRGLLVAEQGPLFIEPGRGASGSTLYTLALRALRDEGVEIVYPYHRLAGRGPRLGRTLFNRRLHALPIKTGYELELCHAVD